MTSDKSNAPEIPDGSSELTPCDRPYSDCGVCKGTGKHDGDPCPACVWRRWFEDATARGAVRSEEEIMSEREEARTKEALPEDGARCHRCGHYETRYTHAVETYAHCPSCGRHTRWERVPCSNEARTNDTIEAAMRAQIDARKAGDARAEMAAVERVLSFVAPLCREVEELRRQLGTKGDCPLCEGTGNVPESTYTGKPHPEDDGWNTATRQNFESRAQCTDSARPHVCPCPEGYHGYACKGCGGEAEYCGKCVPRTDSPEPETVADLVRRAATLMRASKRGEVQAHVRDGNGWIELTLPEHRPSPEGPRPEPASPLTRERMIYLDGQAKALADVVDALDRGGIDENGLPLTARDHVKALLERISRPDPRRESAQDLLDLYERWIVSHAPYLTFCDHACAECVPGGSLVSKTFKCAVHTARARQASESSCLGQESE